MTNQDIDRLLEDTRLLAQTNGWDARQEQFHLIEQATLAERKRCSTIIFGLCESDNVAQRTVNTIWKKPS